jgi:hypothetical protein
VSIVIFSDDKKLEMQIENLICIFNKIN